MALTRKDKPDWFAVTDRVKAIFEMEMASQADLARFLKVPDQRVREWIQRVKEPRAEVALKIERWAEAQEANQVYSRKRYVSMVKAFGMQNQ